MYTYKKYTKRVLLAIYSTILDKYYMSIKKIFQIYLKSIENSYKFF